MSDDVILAMVASTLSESNAGAGNSKAAEVAAATNTTGEQHAPELQGLRLGMTFSSAAPSLGSALKLRDELGVQRLYVSRYGSGVSAIEAEVADRG